MRLTDYKNNFKESVPSFYFSPIEFNNSQTKAEWNLKTSDEIIDRYIIRFLDVEVIQSLKINKETFTVQIEFIEDRRTKEQIASCKYSQCVPGKKYLMDLNNQSYEAFMIYSLQGEGLEYQPLLLTHTHEFSPKYQKGRKALHIYHFTGLDGRIIEPVKSEPTPSAPIIESITEPIIGPVIEAIANSTTELCEVKEELHPTEGAAIIEPALNWEIDMKMNWDEIITAISEEDWIGNLAITNPAYKRVMDKWFSGYPHCDSNDKKLAFIAEYKDHKKIAQEKEDNWNKMVKDSEDKRAKAKAEKEVQELAAKQEIELKFTT
jgi:hypothetical protein